MNEKTSRAKSPITLRRVLTTAAVLLLFALVFVVPAAAEDTTYYVSPTGTGDGKSASAPTTLDTAISNAKDGVETTLELTAGTYILHNDARYQNKKIIFNGTEEGVIFDATGLGNELYGDELTFKNVAVTFPQASHKGLAFINKVVFEDCTFSGTQTLYADVVMFDNCVFTGNQGKDIYYVWTYSAKDVTFDGCTFNTGGKAILVYHDTFELDATIKLNDCVFYSDKSSANDKAAVEVGNQNSKEKYTITITDCVAYGFVENPKGTPTGTNLWGNKNSMGDELLKVTVTLNNYDVTWKVEGEADKTVTVQYGQKPDYGGVPTKDQTPQTSYTFEGWENENGERFTNENLPIVREDVTYTAVFTETQRTYTVLWQNETGFELEKDENVPYGATPSFDGTEPQKAEDEKFTYSFAGWSPKLSAVEGDITYKATYTEDPKEYTITLNTDGGNTLEKITQDYGTAIKLPIPTKEGHLFKGWTPAIPETMPANDLSFTAQWAVKEEENTGNAGNTETTEKPGETTPEVPGELKPETDGTLTFVPAASADVPTFETSEDGTTSVTIASEDGVTIKLKATTGEVTSGAGNSVTGTFDIVETTINKPATLKGSEKPVSYDLVIPMDADKVLGNVPQPAINAEFNAETGNKVANHEGNSYNALAMIQASYSGTGGIDTINSKITGEITLTFTLPATYGQKLVVFHVVDGKDPVLLGKDKVTIAVDQVTGEIIVTAKGTGFSSYVVAQDTTPTAPTGGSSTPQGSSVWLTESQTPTQTPSEQPTTKPTDSAPTDVPTTQPTQTETQSPLSVLAVLAGLGAVAVLRRK